MTGVLLDILARSFVLFIAGAVVAVLVRRRAASVQALVLTAALAGSLALPAAAWLLPSWDLHVLPAAGTQSRARNAATAADRSSGASAIEAPPARSAAVRPAAAAATQDPTAPPTPDRPAMVTAKTPTSLPIDAFDAARPASPLDEATLFLRLTAALWAAGALVLAARLLKSHLRMQRMVRGAALLTDPRLRALIADVRRELGLRRRVALRTGADVSMPIVTGVVRSTLILPEDAAEWPPSVARDVLRHELAHIARWDVAGQLLCHVACAIYWFNPLAWAVAARVAMLRERACDDEVLRTGARPSDYASGLLALVRRHASPASPSAALAIVTPSRLHARIVCLLDPARRRAPLSRARAAVVTLSMTVIVAALGAAQPAARAQETAQPTTPPEASAAASAKAQQADVAATAEASQPAAGLCSGKAVHNSDSMSEHNGDRRWRLRIGGPGCEIDLRVDGRVEFNDDFTDVASIDRDGTFQLDTEIDGVRRRLEIRNDGDSLVRTYEVDGHPHDWDAAGRQWLARFLIDVDRRTAVGIDARLPRLLEQGGPAAVLAETAQMPGDYARSRYYAGLLDAKHLSAAERLSLIRQAARLSESDYYASQVLAGVIRQGRLENEQERDAVVGMIGRMSSDYYRATAIKALADGSLTPDQTAAVLSVLKSMDSDYYRYQVLGALVEAAPKGTDLTGVDSIVRQMDSDFYRTSAIKLIAGRGLGTPQASALLPLFDDLDSDYYRASVIGDLLGASLAEPDLLSAVKLIRGMDSDYYKAAALRDVLANGGATDGVRAAVRDAAEGMSQYYRQQVLDRAGL
ncbi:MAG TPA: M56 family metallopeptidase [Gammaproteobacteria bacterium]|nr:M56 family metallopeptidase [Gammaproteobacteria bacterium]